MWVPTEPDSYRLYRTLLLSLSDNGDVDMVVLPSIDLGNGHHEGIPVALMEAMAYAIPLLQLTRVEFRNWLVAAPVYSSSLLIHRR